MFISPNRFALLSMDDSGDEKQASLVAAPKPIRPPAVSVEKTENPEGIKRTKGGIRSWNLQDGRPAVVREWNVDTSSVHRKRRGGLFSRYSFRDEEKTKKSVPLGYAFQDESPPQETQKPTSPIVPITPPYYGEPPVLFKIQVEDTEKKTDSPPSPSLAERVKMAMESSPKKTFNMDSHIPMQDLSNNTIHTLTTE